MEGHETYDEWVEKMLAWGINPNSETAMSWIRRGAPIPPEEVCEGCGHAISLHTAKYGCEYERGDAWVTGENGTECLMAQGPCGCMQIKYIPCPHELLKWLPSSGNFSCLFCGETVECPEFLASHMEDINGQSTERAVCNTAKPGEDATP